MGDIVRAPNRRAWTARLILYTALVVTLSLAAQAWVILH